MQILHFLRTLHDRLLPLAAVLKFDKKNPVHFHQLALYGTLLELTHGMLVLIERDAKTGVPSLFRSLLEASVELRNLMRDASYVENIEAAHAEQWLRLLKEAKGGSNPYLASLSTLPNLDALIAAEESKLLALIAKGKKPLNNFQRFEAADMVAEYRSMYNFLSCDAHSNTRALISRHIEFNEKDFSVVYYKDEPLETLLAELDSAAGLVVEASIAVHEAFSSSAIGEVRKLVDELSSVRAAYGA